MIPLCFPYRDMGSIRESEEQYMREKEVSKLRV